MAPSLLFLNRISVKNPYLLEDSTYEIETGDIGINMTTNDSIKDITIVFPSQDYYFDNSLMMSCSIYKLSGDNKTYVEKNCYPLNNRVHI